MCEYGADSSPDFTAYADDSRRAHEAYMEPRYIFAGLWFGVAVPFLSSIPFLISLCCSCARRNSAAPCVSCRSTAVSSSRSICSSEAVAGGRGRKLQLEAATGGCGRDKDVVTVLAL